MNTQKIGTAYVLLALLSQASATHASVSSDDVKRVASSVVCDVMSESSDAEVTRTGNVSLATSFHVDKDWDNGYQITVTLKNPSSVATTHWVASFNLPNDTETVASFWGGSYTKSGTLVKVGSLARNGVIAAGESVNFGFSIGNATPATRTLAKLKATGKTLPAAPATPAVPVLQAVAQGSNQASYVVSWNAVEGATSYTLQQSLTSSFDKPTVVYEGTNTSKSFTNQSNNTYYYRVVASNAAGSSSFSMVQSVIVSATPVLASPILNDIVEGTHKGNYTASWSAVTLATSYTLQESTSKDFDPQTVVYQGPAVSKAFTSKPNGVYYYRVQAINAAGTSIFSNVQSVTVGTSGVIQGILGIFKD